VSLVVALALSGCAGTAGTGRPGAPSLPDETLRLNSSAPALPVTAARVITDNDSAFEAKLEAVRAARRSIDLAYYIYGDDHSSAVLTEALIEAARRGVHVRLLADYFTNYRSLDHFSMMERRGNGGAGRLEVRLYGRPTPEIIKDAVFLTLGCRAVMPDGGHAGCGRAKFAEIDRLLATEREGPAPPPAGVSNFNSGSSGLLLSGLYGKNVELIALAIAEGHALGAAGPEKASRGPLRPEDIDRAIEFGRILWRARFGNASLSFARLVATLKVELAFALYGDKLQPIYDTLTAYLPLDRPARTGAALRDWDYLTAFLHHKLLLVDQRLLVLGGRNVEDSYHMAPSPLVHRYLFRDTDVQVELREGDGALTRAFEALWDFAPMTAPLAEVRQHAPNDTLMATEQADAACRHLDPKREDEAYRRCHAAAFTNALDLERRLDAQEERLKARAETFRAQYRAAGPEARGPQFTVDPGAQLYYLENVPFDRDRPPDARVRTYGAEVGREREAGRYIHAVWWPALEQICGLGRPDRRQRLIVHNAYFLPPAPLLRHLGAIVDGRLDCRYVDVTIVTNSADTTDLNIINVVARHVVRAFAAYNRAHRDPQRAARIAYYEYRANPTTGRADRSLHSKVMVFGPDLYIGSANADVRSYMLDSNNGLFIRGAPSLLAAYTAWVDALVADPALVVDRTDWFLDGARLRQRQEDEAFLARRLQEMTAGTELADRLPLDHLAARLAGILDRAHELSAEILYGGLFHRDAPRRFDRLFKLL
jgi:phosphatidylserine/phosphatidylglycerophosphate/cardiolipin synthase-like enzyme